MSHRKVFKLNKTISPWQFDLDAKHTFQFPWKCEDVTVNIKLVRGQYSRTGHVGAAPFGTYNCFLQVIAPDNRKLKITVSQKNKYNQFMYQSIDTEYASADKYSQMKAYGVLRTTGDDPDLLLRLSLQFKFVDQFPFHEKQLRTVYNLGKQFGDITLVPAPNQGQNGGERQDEKKENELDEDGVRGIKMSSLMFRSSSEVFSKMLSNPMREQKEKVIEIATQSVQTLDDMVFFLTTGRLRNPSDLLGLLELSHVYRIAPLNYACLKILKRKVTSETLVTTMTAFDRMSYDDEIGMQLYREFADKVVGDKETLMKGIKDKNRLPKYWRAMIGMGTEARKSKQ